MYENREFFIDCDGIKVHCKLDFPAVQEEKMPLLIIIPGLTGHIEETHIIATARVANEEGYASLRAELYGHGKSEGEFLHHTVMHWMLNALRVVDYAEKLPFVKALYMAGHSQGGLTTVLMGGLVGDKLRAILPLSPAMVIWDGARKGSFLGVNVDNENLPEIVKSDWWQIHSNYVRAARLLPVEESIRMYTKPVLIVHGTDDEAVPYHYAPELQQAYANARLVTIEGDDHCYNHHLDQVEEAIRAFLREVRV